MSLNTGSGVGKFAESIERLTAAIAYLKRYAKSDVGSDNVVALAKKESA